MFIFAHLSSQNFYQIFVKKYTFTFLNQILKLKSITLKKNFNSIRKYQTLVFC